MRLFSSKQVDRKVYISYNYYKNRGKMKIKDKPNLKGAFGSLKHWKIDAQKVKDEIRDSEENVEFVK